MEQDDVELVEKINLHQAHFRVDRYLLRHRLFAGGWSDVVSREIVDRGQVVAVLPVDVKRDEVVLIEQFRPGAYAVGWRPWMLECVAGIVEPGEALDDVARRESVEECGCEITHLHKVMTYLSSPGASTETVNLYVGGIDASAASGLHGLADEGEDIRVHVMSVDDALAKLESGEIVNSKSIIVLQWLAMKYDWLKKAWG